MAVDVRGSQAAAAPTKAERRLHSAPQTPHSQAASKRPPSTRNCTHAVGKATWEVGGEEKRDQHAWNSSQAGEAFKRRLRFMLRFMLRWRRKDAHTKETRGLGCKHLTYRTANTHVTNPKHHGKCWRPSFVTVQIFRHVFHTAAKIEDLLGWAAPPARTRERLLIGWRSSSSPLIGSESSRDPR